MANLPPSSPEPKRQPSKGIAIVEKYRGKMNTLSDSERAEHFARGLQLIYGGGDSDKAKVSRR